jgi:hypothetical protein
MTIEPPRFSKSVVPHLREENDIADRWRTGEERLIAEARKRQYMG